MCRPGPRDPGQRDAGLREGYATVFFDRFTLFCLFCKVLWAVNELFCSVRETFCNVLFCGKQDGYSKVSFFLHFGPIFIAVPVKGVIRYM